MKKKKNSLIIFIGIIIGGLLIYGIVCREYVVARFKAWSLVNSFRYKTGKGVSFSVISINEEDKEVSITFRDDFYGPDQRLSNVNRIRKNIEKYIVDHPEDKYTKYDIILCFASRRRPYLKLKNYYKKIHPDSFSNFDGCFEGGLDLSDLIKYFSDVQYLRAYMNYGESGIDGFSKLTQLKCVSEHTIPYEGDRKKLRKLLSDCKIEYDN